MSHELDALTCPLSGSALIEAAAGTGKTYNIQSLVVRLVVERNCPIDRVIVVTFTVAATAELRERIRRILRALCDSFDAPESVDPREVDRVAALRRRFAGLGIADCDVRARLRDALLRFDDAAIATIHGFCQHVLGEYAFESGSLFSLELVADAGDLVRTLTEDFCRGFYYRDAGQPFRAVFEKILPPAALAADAARLLDSENPPYWGPALPGDPEAELAHCFESCREAAAAWRPGMLDGVAGRFKKSCAEKLLRNCRTLDDPEEELTAKFSAMLDLTFDAVSEGLGRRSKEDKAVAAAFESFRTHPYFESVKRLESARDEFAVALRAAAGRFVRARVAERKEREHLQTYDDLLVRVRDEVRRGPHFVEALRKRYSAAVLDEFQDTDAVQYEIFDTVFGLSPDHALFMVGDPKQAIYSFRGGDIATYLGAVEKLEARGGAFYTLSTNYRAAPELIGAVNRFFELSPDPFLSERILFTPARAPEGAVPGGEANPLRFVMLPEPFRNKSELRRAAIDACAGKIAELMRVRGLRPSDFAVLVFSGSEAQDVAEALGKRNIPPVVYQSANLFDSVEAAEFADVLAAVESPRDGATAARALMTSLCGVTARDFDRDGGLLENRREFFASLRAKCLQGSFAEMFRAFLDGFAVRERLVAMERGERRVSNLLQLGEVLHRQSALIGCTPMRLLEFLRRQLDPERRDNAEEYELMLETDRAAVRIMTVFKSKGLAFPYVMLPTLFAQRTDDRLFGGRSKADRFYDPETRRMRLDLSAGRERSEESRFARMQEMLRLVYVALTRGEKQVTVFWGDCGANPSPLDYLVKSRRFEEVPGIGNLERLLRGDFGDPAALLPPEWIDAPPEPMEETSVTAAGETDSADRSEPPPMPGLRSWSGASFERNYRVNSFSALAPETHGGRGAAAAEDAESDRDVDVAEARAEAEKEPSSAPVSPRNPVYDIPGGALLGLAWHALLEKVDFDASPEAIRELAAAEMRGYLAPFDEARAELYLDATVSMVAALLAKKLCDSEGTAFRLADIGRRDRLSELEFTYALRGDATADDLRKLLGDYARGRFGMNEWPEWRRELNRGFMTGFIDLVFRRGDRCFVADWKSNALGGDPEAFRSGRLVEPMRENFYFLQYLIYSVALVKYLRSRLGRFGEAEYARYYGGVYYFFLRGCCEAGDSGVFFDRVPWPLLSSLEALIG